MKSLKTFCLLFLVFKVKTDVIQMNHFIKANEGALFTYYLSDHSANLHPSKPNSHLNCLSTCTKDLSACTGVEFNTATGRCIGFTTKAVLDGNGEFQMVPGNKLVASFYQGIVGKNTTVKAKSIVVKGKFFWTYRRIVA